MSTATVLDRLKQTRILGNQVVLVPYRPIHVPKYHEWMKSIELQTLTGSEPLSLEEEFEMQTKWVKDKDKVTFIVLDRELYENNQQDEVLAMIGDTNIFLPDPNQEELKDSGEIEIMIAESIHRGKGKGVEAVRLMLRFGHEKLGIKKFVAKIKMENGASQTMFEKIGFIKVGQSTVFEEITMEFDQFDDKLMQITNYVKYESLSS